MLLCHKAFTLSWFGPRERTNIQEKDGKKNKGEKEEKKLDMSSSFSPLSSVLEPSFLSSRPGSGYELCIGCVWNVPVAHPDFAQV